MLKEERQALILKYISLHNKVLSSDLSKELQVSEDTVRRDIKKLADTGKILKVHGGAINKSIQHALLDNSDIYAYDSKQRIADKATSLFKNGMIILCGGGTTMVELAKRIPESLQATFFTISPLVALTLAQHKNLKVVGIGGELTKGANVFIGTSVINQLDEIKPDLCLLVTNGLSLENGMTDTDWSVVQVKKAMIRVSRKLAVLSLGEKLETSQPMIVCDFNQIDYLVTELDSDHPKLISYRRRPDLRLL